MPLRVGDPDRKRHVAALAAATPTVNDPVTDLFSLDAEVDTGLSVRIGRLDPK